MAYVHKIRRYKYTRNEISLGDEEHLPKEVQGDGVVVEVMEVDDEEDGGVLWCC